MTDSYQSQCLFSIIFHQTKSHFNKSHFCHPSMVGSPAGVEWIQSQINSASNHFLTARVHLEMDQDHLTQMLLDVGSVHTECDCWVLPHLKSHTKGSTPRFHSNALNAAYKC